jgi:hypothetical protein
MKRVIFTITGVGYGIVLMWFGVLAAGAGHGVFVPLGIFSSPIVILAGVIPPTPEYQSLAAVTFLLGMALLWGCAGFLSASLAMCSARRGLLALLAVHYLALPVVFHSGDWGYFPRVWQACPWVLVAGFSIYLVGQATLWVLLLRHFFGARGTELDTGVGLTANSEKPQISPSPDRRCG